MNQNNNESDDFSDLDAFINMVEDPVVERGVRSEERVLEFLFTLKRKMLELGVSQRDLGARIGERPTQINRWLTSKSRLPARAIFLLADGVGHDLRLEWIPKKPELVHSVDTPVITTISRNSAQLYLVSNDSVVQATTAPAVVA